MTPAIQLLAKRKIRYTLHQYQHDTNNHAYGEEAAEKMAVFPERVFKTLVVITDQKKLAVAILPITHQLNLKAMAKTLLVKKVRMAEANQVQASTGYVLGGVSPVGQKKSLPTIIDNHARNFETIFVSGGKRGLEVEISPTDLTTLINAKIAIII